MRACSSGTRKTQKRRWTSFGSIRNQDRPLGSPSCTRHGPWDRRVALGMAPGIAELYSAWPLGSPSCTRQYGWVAAILQQSSRLHVGGGGWRGRRRILSGGNAGQGQDALATYPDRSDLVSFIRSGMTGIMPGSMGLRPW
jgi:hypothetical protein